MNRRLCRGGAILASVTAVFLVFGSVMADAKRIADENREII